LLPNRQGAPLREPKLLRRVLQPGAERRGVERVTLPRTVLSVF
jgi:hypothetical protein